MGLALYFSRRTHIPAVLSDSLLVIRQVSESRLEVSKPCSYAILNSTAWLHVVLSSSRLLKLLLDASCALPVAVIQYHVIFDEEKPPAVEVTG